VTEVAEFVAIDAGHLHRSRLLSSVPGIVHGVTRRIPGAGLADGNIGYSAPRDRADAWEMRQAWMIAAELDADRIVAASQVHGTGIAPVSSRDAGKGANPASRPITVADGLTTSARDVVIMTLHADCMPILLLDPVKRAVATVHAGWRGTTDGIAAAAVRAMVNRHGSVAGDLLVYLGPAIGGCCYEVGQDVASAWNARAVAESRALTAHGTSWRFDLAIANREQLERMGVRPENVEQSNVCTMCRGDEWFSHRGQGAATGRYASFIAVTE
jgi:YfiH family protein